MDYNTENTAIFSKRTFLGTLFMFIGSFLCLGITMVGVFTPCIYNYHEHIIIYPESVPVSHESSIVNYFGFDEISNTFFVADDADIVRDWYQDTIREAEFVKRRAIMDHASSGEVPPWWEGQYQGPPVWEGLYDVRPTENGAEIVLSANCY